MNTNQIKLKLAITNGAIKLYILDHILNNVYIYICILYIYSKTCIYQTQFSQIHQSIIKVRT